MRSMSSRLLMIGSEKNRRQSVGCCGPKERGLEINTSEGLDGEKREFEKCFKTLLHQQ